MTTSETPPDPPPLPPAGARGRRASGWMEAGAGWRRQHPTAFVFNVLRSVRAMIFPIIAAIVAARGTFLLIFLGLILAFSIGSALLRYWRYRYRFGERELIVEQGWVFRHVRHVAYSKIQNINIVRSLIHRMCGVSGLQLESASGSEPEAVMNALSVAAIDELHERIDGAKGPGRRAADGPPANRYESGEDATVREGKASLPLRGARGRGRPILRLGIGEVVLHGLVSNRGIVLVAAAVGFLMQGPLGDRVLPVAWEWIEKYAGQVPAPVLEALGPVVWLVLAVVVFLAIMLGLALLSVLYAILRFYGFTLKVDDDNLRAEYGLFTRVAITIPRGRIQLIGFRANPWHRLLGRVSVRVETAGLSGGEESASSLRWLAPILRVDQVAGVLNEVQPEIDWEGFDWRPLHPRTLARMLRVRLLLLGGATVVLAFSAGAAGLFALLATPLVFAYVRGYFDYARWAASPAAIAFRSGWLVKQQSVVRYSKIQVVALSRNPFDRRWGMAAVSADTAGADPAGHRVHIRFMDADSAHELCALLEERMRETEFVW